MNTLDRFIGVLITIILSFLVFFMGANVKAEGTPSKIFMVYLNGKEIGLIKNKYDLLNLIDKEQESIKKKYEVNKVYPPSGLDIQSITTYDDNIRTVQSVYEDIKDIEPFTVSGYQVKITYKETPVEGEETVDKKEPIIMNVLNKKDFEDGFYNTIAAFVGSETLEKYSKGTQIEITETGSTMENIYWDEKITFKKSYLSTSDYIYTNSDDIGKYLLFGTLKDQNKYTVKDGDDISSVANANNLNVDEFLVANPSFASANVLLTAGQVVNTGLISPIVNVVYEEQVIEDVEVPFQTEYKDDDTLYQGDSETLQDGENGTTRVTEMVQYKNGEIQGLYITNKTELTPAVNKIVKRGTKESYGGGYIFYNEGFGNSEWAWPTITPYVITSRFAFRWGKMHQGIDISGCGTGSPIYSVGAGTVVEAGFASDMGNYVYVDHGNNLITVYMHLSKYVVSNGQTVSKGQGIGYMGSSGRSTGTHLHLGVYNGYPYKGGVATDPCKSIFSC